MRVVVDKNIPYLKGLLEPYAEVLYVPQEAFTPDVVRDADALLIRTRTRCNGALLDGSKVQFIGTGTIGFDQIDTAYCARQGITWTNSPGCNAQGVCDYVESALEYAGRKTSAGLTDKTLGIVGVGHVGKLVAEMAKRRGLQVLLCDPPRAEKEGAAGFVGLDEIERRCDIITFHTPLTREGKHPTWHLETCRNLRPDTLLINAARGGVVDEQALQEAGNPFVIDCWEGEPNANPVMVEKALLATYHIAGYTQRGKYNASQMILTALCRHFGLPELTIPNPPADAPHIWDIEAVSRQLKAHPENFETLRETYPLR
ncbi:MAG: 4-phosphoerythronate dehydrogenase [Paludibacteraceae bacterium]|nr:4-phosphoerythronate dehydrogenase [Paludibacteraceae bacterium]